VDVREVNLTIKTRSTVQNVINDHILDPNLTPIYPNLTPQFDPNLTPIRMRSLLARINLRGYDDPGWALGAHLKYTPMIPQIYPEFQPRFDPDFSPQFDPNLGSSGPPISTPI
jgi:hypothetical protein